jgi:hypothetical protein
MLKNFLSVKQSGLKKLFPYLAALKGCRSRQFGLKAYEKNFT